MTQLGSRVAPQVSISTKADFVYKEQLRLRSLPAALPLTPILPWAAHALPSLHARSLQLQLSAWQRWVWSWGWPWMHFKRHCRRSVRITWNDYFRADFPLKKKIALHVRSLIFTQKIYIRTHFTLSVTKKKKKKACWQDLGKCAG